ncbi:MAG: outer membrane protein assembly factor BamD [Deltaproteobacteria bacterium]|nr:outer membrane protein assembly factor BamD [Deltaproteobacteria bacterium]
MMNRTVRAVAVVFVVAFAAACAPKFENMSASEIYDYGSNRFEKRDYSESIEAFEKLIELYPFSTYVTRAELAIADAYFARKRWPEAAVAYKDFAERHPTNEAAPRAIHREGASHDEQRLALDRDQEETLAAEQTLARVVTQYPDYADIADARARLLKVREDLAGRERYIARFYWREKEYYASVMRWQRIVRDFSDTKFLPEALYFSALCYRKLEEPEQAERHEKMLAAKFPDHKLSQKLAGEAAPTSGPAPDSVSP